MTDDAQSRLEEKINYLQPDVPGSLPWLNVPLVQATDQSLEGYGRLVDDYQDFPIEIVRWPASGWRPVDPGTGDEAGTTTGIFSSRWQGDLLMGSNSAVDDEYLLGWSVNPGEAVQGDEPAECPGQVLLWHANYHPDGGQLFYPLDDSPFIVPLALPGDDLTPGDFVAFYLEAGRGLYIHPNVWHEGIFPLSTRARFYDEQGKVHARVSCNIAREFGLFLAVPLQSPQP